MVETYFIIRALDFNENDNPEFKYYNKVSKELKIEPDGAGCYISIKHEEKSIEIDIHCGC